MNLSTRFSDRDFDWADETNENRMTIKKFKYSNFKRLKSQAKTHFTTLVLINPTTEREKTAKWMTKLWHVPTQRKILWNS